MKMKKIKYERKINMANIYLIPTEDFTYRAEIGEDRPTKDAVLLVKERSYPVQLFYIRHDLNMCSELHVSTVNNRDELLSKLNWFGECRNGVNELWDLGKTVGVSGSLNNLFNRCYKRKAELCYEELTSMMA
jgi:hypothetical protein